MKTPLEFAGVTAVAKANVYFDGRVVSRTIRCLDGSRKTLGLIFPGRYHFGTDQAERMEITAGACTVRRDGAAGETRHGAGQAFDVPAKSGFDIAVEGAICEYVCSYLP